MNEVNQSLQEKQLTAYVASNKIQFSKGSFMFQTVSQCLMTHDQIGGNCGNECNFFLNCVMKNVNNYEFYITQ
jgi:hypothetical protein